MRPPNKTKNIAGLVLRRGFVSPKSKAAVLDWLGTLKPLRERRFSTIRPLPEGEAQRWLLRPVYWLGNWQFACLDYYRPPHRLDRSCVAAEAFPPEIARWVAEIEEITRRILAPEDIPEKWHLNTCLINFYGDQISEDGTSIDTARVGEHKDFEPGPVASVSLGERAFFQFVSSFKKGSRERVVWQDWLEDRSLQIFGGRRWKQELFHRVQRVERKGVFQFPLPKQNFICRRINFTFRYVPVEHVIPFARLPDEAKADVREYMEELAKSSEFFARVLAEENS